MATLQKEKRTFLAAYFLIFFIGIQNPLFNQTLFQALDNSLVNGASSGVAVAVTDINGDGLDDIARFEDANTLQILLQLPSGAFQLHYEGTPTTNRQWNLAVFDLNRDGWADLVSSGNQSGIHYWMSNAQGNYTHSRDPRYAFRAQAANIVDMNFDGLAEIFVCNDDGENYTLEGSADIPYDRKDLLPFDFPEPGDYAGNYGSVWEDINNDGLPDLYLSKCFASASEPADPRRINQLFVSNPDSTYTEMAEPMGVADSAQSWSSTFADVDNDGDWDLLVLNHDVQCNLFYNENGQFRKSTHFAGQSVQLSSSVQVIAADFNNDAWIDFIITGQPAALLMNKGDGTFTLENSLLGRFQNEMTTAAAGDLNNDGLIDLYTARHGLYNNPQGLPDQLLFNQNEGNHFLSCQLINKENIPTGLHTLIKIYTPDGIQMRSVRAGEAYGITNSNLLHFGLGEYTFIDSMYVRWPDGLEQKFGRIAGDQKYYISKGTLPAIQLAPDLSKDHLCQGDTVFFDIGFNRLNPIIYHYESKSYDSSGSLNITEAGNYFWIATANNGFNARGEPFYIPFEPNPGTELNYHGSLDLCFGSSIELRVATDSTLVWNDGLRMNERRIDSAGWFSAVVQGACDVYHTDTVMIRQYPEISVQVFNDTVPEGEHAILWVRSDGNEVHWYRSEDGDVPFHMGDTLRLRNLMEDQEYWVEVHTFFENDKVDSVGELSHQGNSKYNGDFVDGALNFEARQDCRLLSVEVETEFPGMRALQLLQNGRLIELDTFQVDSGISRLHLDWALNAGQAYTIKTDRGINFSLYGGYSPKLFRSAGDFVEYPYTDGNCIQIQGSNYSDREYFYFYNWKVKASPDTCASERQRILAVIDSQTISVNVVLNDLEFYPNPVSEAFRLNTDIIHPDNTLRIYGLDGLLHKEWKVTSRTQEFWIDGVPPAVYQLSFQNGNDRSTGLLIVVPYR